MKTQQPVYWAVAVAAMLMVGAVAAEKAPVYTAKSGNVGAGGYDVTAYFDGAPARGDKAFRAEYQGAEWHFASAANRDKFNADPAKYAPQYGGYCAWAVGAKNKLYSGDPLEWTVYNDKLYLNYNRAVKKKWDGDKDKFIVAGDKNWPAILK